MVRRGSNAVFWQSVLFLEKKRKEEINFKISHRPWFFFASENLYLSSQLKLKYFNLNLTKKSCITAIVVVSVDNADHVNSIWWKVWFSFLSLFAGNECKNFFSFLWHQIEIGSFFALLQKKKTFLCCRMLIGWLGFGSLDRSTSPVSQTTSLKRSKNFFRNKIVSRHISGHSYAKTFLASA